MANETRQAYQARQDAWLIGGALHAADTGGRDHHEPEHPYRTAFQRDRERILHCSAFRRLGYKTQVFVPDKQDHFRTRLTHTLEVAQVARTLARALRANEDAAEAVGLAHDLGHSPFGHAGEAALDGLMAGHGGFEHNAQSLRVVEYLEHPYPRFRGLNLTAAVRACLARHRTRYDAPADEAFEGGAQAPLEGQLVDLADEIAYTAADLYDALAAEWIEPADLGDLALWRRAHDRADADMPDARAIHKRLQACRNVLAIMTDDAIAETTRRVDEMRLATAADVQAASARAAGFSVEIAADVQAMQQFLLERVYRHPIARTHADEARRIIAELFSPYLADPSRLPDRYGSRVEGQGLHRVVCDYIAGMTDRFCRLQHQAVCGGAD